MAEFMSLRQAVSSIVRDGQRIALEGFTHLIPFAAGHEIIRQGKRHLAWDFIRRSRENFQRWMKRHVLDTDSFADFRRLLAEDDLKAG